MTVRIPVELDAQAAVDLHTIIGRVRESEAASSDPSSDFDARLREVARALERGLRSVGYVPSDDGWERIPPSRRR